MTQLFPTLGLLLVLGAPAPRADHARKDGLSLTVRLDRKAYGPNDPVAVSFELKNVSGKDLFLGDGYLAPGYHEAGPGRHFEVHVATATKVPLHFWSGTMTEGRTSGIRKVFKLRPGETYKGTIRLSMGMEARRGDRSSARRGGSFEDTQTRRAHVLGQDGQKYTLSLKYQVHPKSHGVWQPPADFRPALLWKGALMSRPVPFEVFRR